MLAAVHRASMKVAAVLWVDLFGLGRRLRLVIPREVLTSRCTRRRRLGLPLLGTPDVDAYRACSPRNPHELARGAVGEAQFSAALFSTSFLAWFQVSHSVRHCEVCYVKCEAQIAENTSQRRNPACKFRFRE